jgi:ABC-type sugar transport system permease subunit
MKRILLLPALVLLLALTLAPTAGAAAYNYWWQRNMPTSQVGHDGFAHNHNYNELYFGPNAGWRSQLWEVTPAGYTHFVKNCSGNCFFAHPAYYYATVYCANRDPYGQTHFVYQCQDQW